MSKNLTRVFMTVAYTECGFEDPDGPAKARASYQGVNLDVDYGAEYRERRSYFTGDFPADYNTAVAWVQAQPGSDRAPFQCSSSVDDFIHDAGYESYEPEPGPAEGRYEVAFSVDTGKVFENLTAEQRDDLQRALNTVQALLYAADGETNRFASDAIQRLECQLDFAPGTDLSLNEKLARDAAQEVDGEGVPYDKAALRPSFRS